MRGVAKNFECGDETPKALRGWPLPMAAGPGEGAQPSIWALRFTVLHFMYRYYCICTMQATSWYKHFMYWLTDWLNIACGWLPSTIINFSSLCLTYEYQQWLKCKIRGGGTLHTGLGPWQWSCAFPWHYNNLRWGNALRHTLDEWRWGNGVPLRPITL